VGFSLLRWKKSGRDWSRGEPPPRGSVEYCGVPELFQPAPPAPASTTSGTIWEITSTELDAANRWVATLARSVDYARQVHGDKVLSAQDAGEFADFYKRWKKFASRVTTWSIVERAREANKAVFEKLLAESKRLRDRFSTKGMPLVPVPHVTDLVLMLRRLPGSLTPREMASRLETVAGWGESMIKASRTTGEWVQRSGMYAAGALLLGPAGVLFAHYVPTSWSGDRRGLEKSVGDARHAARLLEKSTDAGVSYGRGDPVYDEFVRRATRVYVEAAGLFGIRETQVSATAEAVDAGARQVERGSSGLLWLLGIAGVSWLGSRWLDYRSRPPEDDGGEPEEVGDVVVVEPRDHVVVGGDGEAEGEYDPENDRDERIEK
jgi:hypothetical protein